jgi:dTDP-4-amino-4,6-dideoxygalactose transaminase
MVVTGDEGVYQRAGRLRNYGQSVRYHHPELGMNSRLDELQAALLSERLKWLPEFTKRRREIAHAFQTGIRNPAIRLLALPEEPSAHVYHLFALTCQRRDQLQAHLQQRDVQSLIHYPVPVHQQPPCVNIARDPQGLGRSEYHAASCLSLPCHPQMTDADIEKVISAVNSF